MTTFLIYLTGGERGHRHREATVLLLWRAVHPAPERQLPGEHTGNQLAEAHQDHPQQAAAGEHAGDSAELQESGRERQGEGGDRQEDTRGDAGALQPGAHPGDITSCFYCYKLYHIT